MNTHINTKIGTIILIILTITIGAFVWKSIKDNRQSLTQPQNVSVSPKAVAENRTQTVEQNVNDTANWITYTDTKLGYTIKYPEGYTIQKYDSPCESNLNNENGQNIVIWISDFLNNNDDAYENDIGKDKIVNFDIFVNDPLDKCIQNAFSSIGGPELQIPKLIGSEKLTINKYSVLKRNYAHLDPEGNLSTFYFSTWRFEENSKYYTLTYNNGVAIKNPAMQNDLFEKFIENFRFVK